MHIGIKVTLNIAAKIFFIIKYTDDIYFRNNNRSRVADIYNADKQDKHANYLGYDYLLHDFDPTLDKVIKGRLNVNDVIKRHRRVRRSVTKKDPIEHVTKIMESIEEELDDLKV